MSQNPGCYQKYHPGEIRQVGASTPALAPFVEAPPSAEDALFIEEQLELLALDAGNRGFGLDLREEAGRITTHPALVMDLAKSDRLVDTLSGRVDLKRRRRRGILRHLDGPYRGLPVYHPRQRGPIPPDCIERIYPLWDELEWILLIFRKPSWKCPGMPVSQTLGHVEVRAILGVSAWRLDKWLAQRNPILRGRLELPRSRGVRFDTAEFFAHLDSNRS